MFKHILVPTDFGEASERALEVALDLARDMDAQVSIAHVYLLSQPLPYNDGMMWPAPPIEASARKALDACVARARTRWDACEGILRPPAAVLSEELLTVARERGADLIVMGTHGRRGVPRLVLGSTAERVVRSAPIPVLTISLHGDFPRGEAVSADAGQGEGRELTAGQH